MSKDKWPVQQINRIVRCSSLLIQVQLQELTAVQLVAYDDTIDADSRLILVSFFDFFILRDAAKIQNIIASAKDSPKRSRSITMLALLVVLMSVHNASLSKTVRRTG